MPESMMNLYKNSCNRCGRTVYQVDQIGPLKDFTFYHTGCFKCYHCSSKLTLKTYCNNQDDQDDKEVYCSSHVPKIGPGHLDGEAVGIKSALNVPRSSNAFSDQIRPGGRPSIDGDSILGNSPWRGGENHSGSSENGHNSSMSDYKYGRFDSTALHIAHVLNATKIQKSYSKPLDQFMDVKIQKQMEMKHRLEEDDLYQKFAKQREEQQMRIEMGLKEEWESELEKLTEKFNEAIESLKNGKDDETHYLSSDHFIHANLQKSLSVSTNYRAISKNTIISKIIDHKQ
ncbi:unnamed protein product, partial [Meganyctiphanes norvegica]